MPAPKNTDAAETIAKYLKTYAGQQVVGGLDAAVTELVSRGLMLKKGLENAGVPVDEAARYTKQILEAKLAEGLRQTSSLTR